jgi:hypothetical protein
MLVQGQQARGLGVPAPAVAPTPLSPQAGARLAAGEFGSSTIKGFNADRFVMAGGQFNSDILHPAVVPFEQLYRRLPEEGMYSPDVSPSNPFVFELGAFTVPEYMSLMIFDLRPDIYRFSGVDSGDFVPIEARRFGSIMGFDLTVDQRRQGNVNFQLDPVPIQQATQQAFVNQNLVHPTFDAGQFAIGKSNQFASVAGVGTALLPQRPTRFGALNIPFTLFAKSKQTVQVRCVIFKRLPAPIAFIEYDIAGVLVPETWMNNMIESVKPPVRDGEEGSR